MDRVQIVYDHVDWIRRAGGRLLLSPNRGISLFSERLLTFQNGFCPLDSYLFILYWHLSLAMCCMNRLAAVKGRKILRCLGNKRERSFGMFSRLGNCKSHSHNWTSCVLGTRTVQPKWCTAKFVTVGDSRREDKVDNRIRFTNTTERNGDWRQICNDLPTYTDQNLPLSIWVRFLSSTPCPHSL